ncbi:ParB N-terminal domain-containing protein [Curtobacterium flaccumfaciens pv. flaccumfaciens]|uniref:ParB/RepB/Spo0J family partition protein n=1 Tax=Curtobacterium flaccumfaciens TaxID=2035 RepID=UPI00217E92BF|nr:ParB N-terminal domain-containing protein [Curtobacterium flaccumfaciens]MCS6586925.1 ParB N-terminal domain-containing protein [Curtobacterium flaccumfaciens pv. flaccumfaciens]
MTMTENITVTHLTDQPQPETPTVEAAPAAAGVDLVHVPAADVVIENNVRTAADLDPAFLASVKQHGVLLPTIGYRNADGAVVVRDGQMRVLAAREAGREVPVFVTARDDSTAKRIAEQLVANERRTALTDGDRLAAYRQLEIEGLSVTAIARETGTKRDTVKQTLTVAKSDAAATAVASGQATFTQALILAEFDGDDEAVTELTEWIAEGYDDDELTHVAARLRRDRERAAAVDALTAELTAAGKRVVTDDDDYAPLSRFTNAGDDVIAYDDRTPITEDEHAECPGAAYEVRQYGEVVAVPVCATPNVHTLRVGRIGVGASASAPAEPKSDADAEAEAEERKAARRLLVANNKAWDAADDVRREWIAGLLQRKNAPKDAARFVAIALTRHANTRYASGMVSARSLLGIESSGWDGDTLSQWVEQHPAKGLHMSLAVVFAGFENTANREWWRTPDADSRGYLNQLAAWGYPLSPVEKIAAGIRPDAEPEDGEATPAE